MSHASIEDGLSRPYGRLHLGPTLQKLPRLEVFGAIQFPSWYNIGLITTTSQSVFGAIQFPSWYNLFSGIEAASVVFGAIQFPSWYNFISLC